MKKILVIGSLNMDYSIEFGNKVASITVSRKGAQNSIPSYNEVII